MHLLITDKCDRDCKDCCNKQYDVKSIPVATKEEFKPADNCIFRRIENVE